MPLERQQVAQLTLDIEAFDAADGIDAAGEARRLARLDAWRARVVRLHAPAETPLVELAARATADVGSFAMLEGPEDEWLTPAAGAPLYMAMWGRDALTTSWQSGIFDGGAMLADTLERVARLQGTRIDPERDEEPGRMINQAKLDPDSRLGRSPFGRFYADVASPFMFIIGLGYHYMLTGDRETLGRHWGAAQRVLEWADTYGDRDGDGYIEYLTRSPAGPTHQGWKDSENAVVYEDGTPVAPPIAPCEIQGYWHVSLQYMAVFALVMGERAQARALWQRAADLRARFNRDFWMEDEGFVAFGLDAGKRPIRALTSNAGQCLPTGIVSKEHVPRLVRRLFASDLFSGWGIRTLSSRNPAYNPLDYHLGSVWPVENATTLFGLRRYGLNDRALELARALYDLARLWPGGRIPECVGGYARDEAAHPGAYPRANAPQAWNQSVWAIVVQALLGLVPCAPLHLLLVDPVLPPWLPELTIRNVRIGHATVSLRFWRAANGGSHYEVIELDGPLNVLRQPWVESLSTHLWDRLVAATESTIS
jgi:glycogen debranching enzyme